MLELKARLRKLVGRMLIWTEHFMRTLGRENCAGQGHDGAS